MSDEAAGRDPDRGCHHTNAVEKTGTIIDKNMESARHEGALGVCMGSKTIAIAAVDRMTAEKNEDAVVKAQGKPIVTIAANAVKENSDDPKAGKGKKGPVRKKTLARVKDAMMRQKSTTTRCNSTETKIP